MNALPSRRPWHRRAAAIGALLTALSPIAVPAPALADAVPDYVAISRATPTTMPENPPGSEGAIRATLKFRGLAAGDTRNLRAEAVVGNSRVNGEPGRVSVSMKITCNKIGGSTLPTADVWPGGPNLLRGGPDKTLMGRILFRAPEAGDYECHERVYVGRDLSDGEETAALVSGFLGDISGPIDPAHSRQVVSDTPANLYFDNGKDAQVNVLSGYRTAANATSFVAVSDIYTTSCYQKDNHCPTGNPDSSGTDTARIYARLVATPSVTTGSCAVQATNPTTTSVSRSVHHTRITQALVVNLPAAGCGTWTINSYVKDDGGKLPFVVNTANPYTVTYARPAY
ncbi:hypothetical protein GCM10010123_33590 [Pilimelia anulata]|uniref:Uncharacterized protein n=1 Tax=Pilimelia anulata TaxID=53371 RepID=A0A8J3FCM3_9ACTN|nr:hypothetical protein [Pilimelia anulata]GGK00914.1 hypothetical protein GCM10010123_33590 [Pilimelia anulata]